MGRAILLRWTKTYWTFFTVLNIHEDIWFFVRRNTKLAIVDSVLFKASIGRTDLPKGCQYPD